jgi:hypothetical protein
MMAGTYDTTAPVTLDSISRAYGWTVSYMRSQPELWSIVQQALNPGKVATSSAVGGAGGFRVRQQPGTAAAPATTLGEFNTMLQGTQWFQQGSASLQVANTAQQAQAIAQQNAQQSGQPQPTAQTASSSSSTTFNPGLAAQGGANATPFSNLNYTWGSDPNAFAAAKVWVAGPGATSGRQASTGGAPGAGVNQGGSTSTGAAIQVGAAAYMEYFFHASQADVTKLQTSLEGLGVLKPGFQVGVFDDNTQTAIKEALYNVYQYNDPNVTVDSYLARGFAVETSGSANKTINHTTTYYTSLQDAEGTYQKVTQSLLGRDPTAAEYASAYGALHQAEVANPATGTETIQVDPSGNVKSDNTVQTGGIGGLSGAGATAILQQQAKSAPDYASMVALSYADALSKMAGAVNSAGSSTSGV